MASASRTANLRTYLQVFATVDKNADVTPAPLLKNQPAK